jgi:hypothetical protein
MENKNKSGYVGAVGFVLIPTDVEIKSAFPNGQPIELREQPREIGDDKLSDVTGKLIYEKEGLFIYAIKSNIKTEMGRVGFIVADIPDMNMRHGSYCYWKKNKFVKGSENFDYKPIKLGGYRPKLGGYPPKYRILID